MIASIHALLLGWKLDPLLPQDLQNCRYLIRRSRILLLHERRELVEVL